MTVRRLTARISTITLSSHRLENVLVWADAFGEYETIAGIKPAHISDVIEVRVIEPDPQRALPTETRGDVKKKTVRNDRRTWIVHTYQKQIRALAEKLFVAKVRQHDPIDKAVDSYEEAILFYLEYQRRCDRLKEEDTDV